MRRSRKNPNSKWWGIPKWLIVKSQQRQALDRERWDLGWHISGSEPAPALPCKGHFLDPRKANWSLWTLHLPCHGSSVLLTYVDCVGRSSLPCMTCPHPRHGVLHSGASEHAKEPFPVPQLQSLRASHTPLTLSPLGWEAFPEALTCLCESISYPTLSTVWPPVLSEEVASETLLTKGNHVVSIYPESQPHATNKY